MRAGGRSAAATAMPADQVRHGTRVMARANGSPAQARSHPSRDVDETPLKWWSRHLPRPMTAPALARTLAWHPIHTKRAHMNTTASSSAPAIETIGLIKRFGERVAVDAVNLTVPA